MAKRTRIFKTYNTASSEFLSSGRNARRLHPPQPGRTRESGAPSAHYVRGVLGPGLRLTVSNGIQKGAIGGIAKPVPTCVRILTQSR